MGIARVGERIRYEPTRMRAHGGRVPAPVPPVRPGRRPGGIEEIEKTPAWTRRTKIYLDYTGGGLHGTSQVHKYEKLLHVVRVAAGTTMVIGAIAFSFAYFEKRYWPYRSSRFKGLVVGWDDKTANIV